MAHQFRKATSFEGCAELIISELGITNKVCGLSESAITHTLNTFDNLHPDILASEMQRIERGYSSKVVRITDPGKGMGSIPTEGLVDIEYQCSDIPRRITGVENGEIYSYQNHGCELLKTKPIHTHGALYGPKIVKFHDECKHCSKPHYSHSGENHDWERAREDELDWEHYTLYAD